jgi:hypothetical protein
MMRLTMVLPIVQNNELRTFREQIWRQKVSKQLVTQTVTSSLGMY